MSQTGINPPSMFQLAGVPPGFFGETHVVISVWSDASIWNAEYSILSKRPAESLIQKSVTFDVSSYPSELPPVDKAFMEAEALSQAKIDLILELEQRAKAAGREDLAYLPIELQPEPNTPVTLWVHDIYPEKFRAMFDGTASPSLKRYLQLVMSIGRIKGPN